MKLIFVDVPKRAVLDPIKKRHWWSTQYWTLRDGYSARFITDGGTYHLRLKAGWVTDKRSGSGLLDWCAPKDGNNVYQACVFAHDASYSGWLDKPTADELFVHQGFSYSAECGTRQAQLSYDAVSLFGSAYNLEDEMPAPYTENRNFESLKLLDK